MKLKPIINSPLVNDLYKFNMGNIIYKKFNDKIVIWCFKCRNDDVRFTPEMIQEIREQIDWYCNNIKFSKDDIEYLRISCPWLSDGYLNMLKHWNPDRNEIFVNEGNIQAYNDCGLAIEARGTWLDTSFYEIPVLAIVNEVYFAFKYGVGAKDIEFQRRTIEKFDKLVKGKYDIGTFSEFGLRRRYSADMQDWLIKYIVDQKIPGFVGTSNVYLAKKYEVKSVGTQAHEYFMAYQGDLKISPAYSNYYAMKDWVDEYQTRNGIALTDTLGTDLFLKDFDLTFANLFSGVRHDSGDPIEWGEKLLAHYKKLNINPQTKTLLFSDSLDFEKATLIKKHFDGKCNIAFGIGTYLAGIQASYDETDVHPLNIVMKMTECNGYPVAKLSNTLSKAMCKNNEYIDYLKRCINWRMQFEK